MYRFLRSGDKRGETRRGSGADTPHPPPIFPNVGRLQNTKSYHFLCALPRCEMREGFRPKNPFNELYMKKFLRTTATVALLCAMVFLGGEWPEGTPRKKVITLDAIALAVVAGCGVYLKKEYDDGQIC